MSIRGKNSAEESHYLAIDFGLSKVGLALADSETRIAFAYGMLDNDKSLIEKLEDIISREGVGRIIIGRTANWDKTEKHFDIEKIGEDLEKATGLPVEYQEEMFTTRMAQANLKEAGAGNIKKLDNQEAARLILEGWLERMDKN